MLDENEIAAYLFAMSKINDGKTGKTADDITYDEWKTAQESMGILSGEDMTNKEIKLTNKAFPIIGKIETNIDDLYTADLSTISGITEEERGILQEALPILQREGYTQDMIDNYGRFAQALRSGYNGFKS